VSAVALFVSFICSPSGCFENRVCRSARDRPPDKRWRDDICLACGILMILAVLWAASSMFTHAPVFLPESIAIAGFAVSWLTKGEAYKPVMQMVRRFRPRDEGSAS